MKQQVVIFEGPAGSGKSYLFKAVAERFQGILFDGPWLPEIERPRAYVGDYGLWHAQMKDYRSTLHMLMAAGKPVLIDRWSVSQQIYDHLRAGKQRINEEVLGESLAASIYSLDVARYEHQARLGQDYGGYELDLLFVFLCSPATVVNRLRQNAIENGRVYPYDAASEVALYSHASFALNQWSLETPTELAKLAVTVRTSIHHTSDLTVRHDQVMAAVGEFIAHDHIPAVSKLPTISSESRHPQAQLAAA